MTIKHRGARWTVAGLLAGAVAIAGCNVKDELLAPQQPGVLGPGDIASAGAAGAEALRVGAEGALQQMVGGGTVNTENLWMMSDLFTDVWKSGDTFLERNETDQRAVQSSNGVWSQVYIMAHRARGYTRDAAAALAAAIPSQPGEQAEMWFIMGFAEKEISQDFCNGTPFSVTQGGVATYQPGITNEAGFQLALTHLDSALALSGGTDSVAPRVKQAALIAKAQALVDLGRFADAAALVPTSAVPTSFVYSETFSQPTVSNEIWTLNASQSSARYVVGDSFDLKGRIGNAIPFASAKDPRVPISGGSTSNAAVTAIDKATPWVGAFWTVRTQPIIVVSGLDARLIEAEAKLNTGDYAGMISILNALRAAPPSLGPITPAAMAALPTPATKDDAINVFFREKAFWQFGRGQRLGDLRRLVRQYGRSADQVFPTGVFHKGGNYSGDVNIPIPDSEKSNPLFTGCIDRNA
jgi:hypothetical protein